MGLDTMGRMGTCPDSAGRYVRPDIRYSRVTELSEGELVMTHIEQRISERITDENVAAHIYRTCVDKASRLPKTGSYAVLIGRVSFVGTPWSDASNGNLAVLIVREGRMVTFMYRRDTQPWEPAALSVDAVVPHKVAQ